MLGTLCFLWINSEDRTHRVALRNESLVGLLPASHGVASTQVMGLLEGSTCAEEGALRILEVALAAWGQSGRKHADNVSIVVVYFTWRDGSPLSNTVKLNRRRGSGGAASGSRNSEQSTDDTAPSVVFSTTSGVSTRGGAPRARGVGLDGVRGASISFSASCEMPAATEAVSTTDRGTSVWTSVQLPSTATNEGRARRNLTLSSGLSCTVDVSGEKAAQLDVCHESSADAYEIELHVSPDGSEDKRRQLVELRERLQQLRERLQPEVLVTVENGGRASSDVRP